MTKSSKFKEMSDYMAFVKVEPKSKEKPKKQKKQKKNKGKLADIELLENGNTISSYTEAEEVECTFEMSPSLEQLLDNYMDDEEEDTITGKIAKGQRKKYQSKKTEDEFEKSISEELTLLYNALEDNDKYNKEITKVLDPMLKSKTRGMSKYAVEMMNTKLSNNTARLQTIKEIISTKFKIADLNMKNKKNNNEGESANSEQIANAFLAQIIGTGRNNFMTNVQSSAMLNSVNTAKDEEYYDDFEDDDIDFNYDTELSKRDVVRTEADELRIKYDNRNPKVYIRRHVESGEWEFVTYDKDGAEIDDYPVPTMEQVGTLKFSSDGSMGTDSHGRSYRVLEVGGDEYSDSSSDYSEEVYDDDDTFEYED